MGKEKIASSLARPGLLCLVMNLERGEEIKVGDFINQTGVVIGKAF